MRSQDDGSLEFDDVRIDFAGRRLWRGGIEQPLEPKAFAVLALLAGAPGRVFTRDDILDAVWGHRHVTPGVLSRVMTLLRHALDEDAQHPRRLHTVHGTGYRFDLPVVPELPPGTQERRVRSERRSPATSTSGFAPGGSRNALLAAIAVVLLAAAAFAVWRALAPPSGPAAALRAQIAATSPPILVVMPLKPIGEAGSRDLAAGLGEELIGTLARIEGLRVIARESTVIAAAESTDLDRLMQRLRITHALEGSLQQTGQQLRIRLRLVEAGSGQALWSKDFDRDASEVLVLQREIAQAVATSLALRMGLAAQSGKSGDAEFLRRYLAARQLLTLRQSLVEDTAEPAEVEFRALLRERPDDARLHEGLAVALSMRAHRRPRVGAPMLWAEALEEAAIALRLDPSLPSPYLVQASADCRNNRWESCLALLQKARALAPGSAPDSYDTSITLARLGYLDRAAAAVREGIALDPINPNLQFFLGRILDTQGRHEEAREHFARVSGFANYARWFNAVWQRDYAAALQLAETGFDAATVADTYGPRLKPSYVAASRALLDPSLWPQAESEMRKFEQEAGLMNFCRVLVPDAPAHPAALIADLDGVRRRSYSSWDLLLWTKDLAYLRRNPAFQDYLRDNGILDYWKRHGFPAQCRVQGDGVVCD